MDHKPPQKLAPRSWKWDAGRPVKGWLNEGTSDPPVVWQAVLTEDAAILSGLFSSLSSDERTRLERLRMPDDQRRFLIGRGLLRLLLGAQLGLPPECVPFQYGPFGKPSVVPIAGALALHFNVSHSGKIVLLAFHPRREVGVDVEEMRGDFDCEAIAERMFPASKYRDWTVLEPPERMTTFYRDWTRHEAALKALGLGFSEETKAERGDRLTCFDLEMPDGYQGALALSTPI